VPSPLGSYEAGVLYEIITALGKHNTNPATAAGKRIEIDVLTGASAGGRPPSSPRKTSAFAAADCDGTGKSSHNPATYEVQSTSHRLRL
jgi:hypothetical protein